MESYNCPKCGKPSNPSDKFCSDCGTVLSAGKETITKSRSKLWKTLIITTAFIVIAIGIWLKVDPNASETLGKWAGGIIVAAIFLLIIFKGKRGGRGRSSGSTYYNGQGNMNDGHWNTNDDDSDSGDSDDGGSDD